MRHAFGLIVDHLGGAQRLIVDTTTAFKLSQGNAARDALFCVRLAQAGWSGVQDALLAEGSYYDLFTDGVKDPELLTHNLGKEYYSDGTFKPYPCCRMNHAAIDCALDIVNKNQISGEDIGKVTIFMSAGALRDIIGQPFRILNSAHASAGFSVQYNVASVLLRGSSEPEHFTDSAIRDPAIRDFINHKINMAELTEGNGESARLHVIMQDGREFERFTEIAKGDPRNPVSRPELLAKYRANIKFSNTVSVENGEKIVKMVEDLENVDNVKKLVDLLVV
jgi:2-methylcitrate dehydratase PrpD